MSGGPYQNSGLARFGASPINGVTLTPQYNQMQPYRPALFNAPTYTPVRSASQPVGGLFGGGYTDPSGGGGTAATGAVGPSNDQGATQGIPGSVASVALGLLGLPPALGMAVNGIGATPGVGNDADAAAAAAANGEGMGPAGIGPGEGIGDTGGNTNGPADSAGDGGGGSSK